MGKKVALVIAVIVLLGLGYWWWSQKEGAAPASNDTSAPAGDTAAAPAGLAQDCGNNLGCGNALLAACNPGSFSAQGGALLVKTTVVGKVATGCNITSSVATAQFAGLADAFDVNKDGQLPMACTVQSGLNFDALTLYLKGAGLAKCSGELKSFYDSI
ncbi:hypothetical protein A3H75_02505 [Candidatus Uhrbacteria bacterium RIFCSPLOWO2_02_FULL_51_9]|uniref:Uncharacterized protein n=1 Tax=Candidatus Uhrbacteria bacterium RIFCSPLOWO2_02_FULL_51_9 TaxID=1802410 RepID=A0A1F7VH84_9BACT|nr:MAG: hypothetical protein A3H75_02505 [Candidatus Uhrbacteria bacterium RIFCSPLOWO2_02_FULL_51_9]